MRSEPQKNLLFSFRPNSVVALCALDAVVATLFLSFRISINLSTITALIQPFHLHIGDYNIVNKLSFPLPTFFFAS